MSSRDKKIKNFFNKINKIADEKFIKEIIEKFKEIDIKRGYNPTIKK